MATPPLNPSRPGDAEAALATNAGPPSSPFGESATALARQIAMGGGHAVERRAGRAAVALWEEADGLYPKRRAVRPDQRRRGFAQHLLEAVAEEARCRALPLPLPRLGLRVGATLQGNLRVSARAAIVEIARPPLGLDAARRVAVMERRTLP